MTGQSAARRRHTLLLRLRTVRTPPLICTGDDLQPAAAGRRRWVTVCQMQWTLRTFRRQTWLSVNEPLVKTSHPDDRGRAYRTDMYELSLYNS